jgi:hypothetical protein
MNGFTAAVLLAGATLATVAGCDRGREADNPSGYGAQAGQYTGQPGQGTPGQYGSTPGYGPQAPPSTYGQPTAQTAPPAGQPSPFALPCQSDITCGSHKCNLSVGKCAWPCAASSDCANGFGCVGAGGPTAMCIPGAP